MGDFNDYPHNKSIAMAIWCNSSIPPLKTNKLYITYWPLRVKQKVGSYKYKGEWGYWIN